MVSSRKRAGAVKTKVVLIPLSEGGELVHYHPKTLRRWISKGWLTGYTVAGSNHLRIDRDELLGLVRRVPAATRLSSGPLPIAPVDGAA